MYQTVGGSRRFVIAESYSSREWQECARCGIRRKVNLRRKSILCRDCQAVDPTFGQVAHAARTA